MSIPSFSSRPIPSMFMHCQGLVNLWPWTANCLITWFFSVCSWEERISHCLQLSLVSKLLSTNIAGHCPPSLCCVKVWWLSDYEQQRVQNIKRQQDLETSLKSSLNWIQVKLEIHGFQRWWIGFGENIEHFLFWVNCLRFWRTMSKINYKGEEKTWFLGYTVFYHTVLQCLYVSKHSVTLVAIKSHICAVWGS